METTTAGGGHVHAPENFGRAFAVGIGLNVAFVLVEAGFGLAANSMALIADAGHNLSDVLGLVVAWVASVLPAAALRALHLRAQGFVDPGGAVLRGVPASRRRRDRLGGARAPLDPAPVAGATVMAVAAVGIAINGFTAWLLASGRRGDLNIRGAYLHMAADAAVSAGVVVAGLVILLTGFLWLDPVVSLVIVGVIVWGTWGLLRDSLAMSLGAVPPGIRTDAVRALLAGQPGVAGLHDLHIWPMR